LNYFFERLGYATELPFRKPFLEAGRRGQNAEAAESAAIPQRFVLGRIFGGLVVCVSGFTVI